MVVKDKPELILSTKSFDKYQSYEFSRNKTWAD